MSWFVVHVDLRLLILLGIVLLAALAYVALWAFAALSALIERVRGKKKPLPKKADPWSSPWAVPTPLEVGDAGPR